MTTPIIEVQRLTFQYEQADVPVLSNISIEVEAGEVVLLVGPSGSGKSSLILSLNGLIPQRIEGEFSGRVMVAGLELAEHEVAEIAEKIGVVFQDPEAQFCTIYVEDEVAFGLENLRYPRDEIARRVRWAMEQVGITEKIGVRLEHLSGGEKQKVALASILAMDPPVLALDAPTAYLDPASARDFYHLLRRLKAELGKTLILVEPQVDEIIEIVDRLVVLDEHGRVVLNGKLREIVNRDGATTLAQYGLWTPAVWDVADILREQGFHIAQYPFSVEQAVASFVPLLSSRPLVGLEPLDEPEPMPAAAPAIVAVRGLSHIYRAGATRAKALDAIELTMAHGDFCAIVGQNGAGKTTLAKYLVNILPPPPGTVFLSGTDVAQMDQPTVNQHIGYVFQNPEHQFVEDTVFDELAYSLRVRGVDEPTVRGRVQQMMEQFQLRSLAALHPFALSQGQKRRLSVATMLIVGPEVLLLDEPTMGLDRGSALSLMRAMCDLNTAGKTIVFITHDMRLVAEYARSVVVMADGAIIFQGAVRELFAHPDLLERAALLAPPLVQLTQRVRVLNPAFPALQSVGEVRQLLEQI